MHVGYMFGLDSEVLARAEVRARAAMHAPPDAPLLPERVQLPILDAR